MIKYGVAFLVLFFISAYGLSAQEVLNLYPGAIPGSKTAPADYKESTTTGKDGKIRITETVVPSLTIYLPAKEKSTGAAVIICPGGGYSHLAIGPEGYDVARKFNEIGVAAFVLKYRLPSDAIMADKSIGPMQDAEQAIYLVRKNASQWNVNPSKIGIIGFSAGGHLASTLTVHYDDVKIEDKEGISLRPDFSVLIYPVISFLDAPNVGSMKSLIGENGTEAQKHYFSNEEHVSANTPITFLVQANDDKTVPVRNSIIFNEALTKYKVPSEMHLYQAGGHGFGLNNPTTADQWFDRLSNWMKHNKLLN